MIYIVSSLPRSGSSMTMRCLEAGGLACSYDASQEFLNVFFGSDDYRPNAGGFYALDVNYRTQEFIGKCEGKAVKVPHTELLHLPPHDYRVLFLVREPQEILASMQRFMPGAWDEATAVLFYDLVMPALIQKAAERSDMKIQTLNYADIVADPAAQLGSLGWPIDIRAAAAIVDPSLYRFRLKEKK